MSPPKVHPILFFFKYAPLMVDIQCLG